MSITPSIHLKTAIMRRVRMIWFVRRALPWLILETAVVAVVALRVAEYVFVNKVLENAVLHTFARSPFMIVPYFARAFLNTGLVEQILLAGSLTFAFLLVRDLMRSAQAFVLKRSNFSGMQRVV